MTSRTGPQPADEWTFVPREDDDDELGNPSVELAAMHIEQDLTPARDAGRADVALGDGPGAQEVTFDDEQPEERSVLATQAADAETEPDLEDILESQHYAFENEAESETPSAKE